MWRQTEEPPPCRLVTSRYQRSDYKFAHDYGDDDDVYDVHDGDDDDDALH